MSTATADQLKQHRKEWVEFCTKYPDIFMHAYCGYWACGIRPDKTRTRWLVYAGGQCKGGSDDIGARPTKEQEDEATAALEAGKPLPEGWYLLDAKSASKAFTEGQKRYGVNWYDEKGDGITYDVVIQLALLGDIVYG